MKKLAVVFVLSLVGFISRAQDASGVTVTVIIENVLSDGGTILGGLHTADTFMKGQGIANTMTPGAKGEATLTFENVTPGDYAVMVMHDANDNKQMYTEANGIPKESYANTGTMELYGPPTFDGSKFEVTDEDMEFRLRF